MLRLKRMLIALLAVAVVAPMAACNSDHNRDRGTAGAAKNNPNAPAPSGGGTATAPGGGNAGNTGGTGGGGTAGGTSR